MDKKHWFRNIPVWWERFARCIIWAQASFPISGVRETGWRSPGAAEKDPDSYPRQR